MHPLDPFAVWNPAPPLLRVTTPQHQRAARLAASDPARVTTFRAHLRAATARALRRGDAAGEGGAAAGGATAVGDAVANALLRDDGASWLVWETVENFAGLDVPLVVMAGLDPSGVRNAPTGNELEMQPDVRDPLAYIAMTRATYGTVVVEPNAARFARHYVIRAVEGGGYEATGDAALGDVVVVVDASGRPRLWPRNVNLAEQGLVAVPSELLEPLRAGSLVTLNLSANQLASLPEEMGGLVSLVELDLEGNQLTSLPEGVGGLVSLETLNLQENRLTALPEGITSLAGLTYLDLGSNPLVRPQTPTVEAWLAALAASGCNIYR
jgi:hypothetical protein